MQLVVIHSPCNHWSDLWVREYFNALVDLKLKGYGKEYPDGVLAVDTTDFFASHLLICTEERGALRPLSGNKLVTLSACRRFHATFPAIALARQARAPEHERAIERILARAEHEGREIGYHGSWTIDPRARQDRRLARELREAYTAANVRFHLEYAVPEMILGGTLRFKTERLFSAWGHRPLGDPERVLEPIHVAHLAGEPVQIMHLRRFSPEALALAEKWDLLWRDRIELGASPEGTAQAVAA